MAETAQQTMYRQEMIAGFEVRQSLLRDSTTTEAVIKGNQAVFLVADSGGATAVTRGANGRIPGRADDLTQNTVTMTEWHDKPERSNYNIWAGQGDQRGLMQKTCQAVINRKIDSQIITILNTGTVNAGGTAVAADLNLIMRALTILGINDVPMDGKICGVVTPAFWAYMSQIKEFGSGDYVERKPFPNQEMAWNDVGPRYYNWQNVKWLVHPALPGVGTAAEKCFMYHESAIGHAANSAGMQALADYNEEDDYSWARCSMFMEALLLQNSGVVVMNHNGSGYAAG